MQKVFISWCGADREIKNAIYAKMRASLSSDVEIWESDEHCISNFSEECIRSIRESDVVVLLLSNSAQTKSTYVINEVIEARSLECQGKLNIVVYNVDSCPLTDAFAMQINHISDANHVKNMRGEDDGNIGVLIDRVKILLKRRAEGNPVKPLQAVEPKIAGLPITNNNYYVKNSRNDVIDVIHKALQSSSVVFVNELSGYGRKSVAKVYASAHASEYDYALELHSYCESITDFFARAIQFENINDEIYAKLDEKQTILKKLELLKQIAVDCGKKVLILASYVKIANSDVNDFVFSCLKALPVKIMFVTETVPKEFSDRFATVSVGKMANAYLQELFFHYVDLDELSQRDLQPVLNDFFDSVGGHTSAVELTAKTVADEFGLSAEDIVEALNKVRPDADNDLSQRIYFAYSQLFSLKQFNDSQLRVLTLLSLLIDRPAPEKFVVDMLKCCDAYDSTALKALCDMGWIKRDALFKTLGVEAIIAKVCLSGSSVDTQTLAKCLSFCASKLTEADLAGEMSTALFFSAKIYRYLKADSFAMICDKIADLFGNTQLRKSCLDEFDDAFTDRAEKEGKQLGEQFEYATEIIVSAFFALVRALNQVDEDKDVISRADFVDGFLKVSNEVDDDVAEAIEQSGVLGEIYFKLLSNQDNVSADTLAQWLDYLVLNKRELTDFDAEGCNYVDEADSAEQLNQNILKFICQTLGMLVVKAWRSLPDGLNKLNFSQSWAKFVDTYGEFCGKTTVYNAHSLLLATMKAVNYDVKEMDREATFCLSLINRHRESLFASSEAYNDEIAFLLITKTAILIEMSLFDDAIETLINAVSNYNTERFAERVVNCVDDIVGSLNNTNDFEKTERLVSSVFTPKFVEAVVKRGKSDEIAKVNAYLSMLSVKDESAFSADAFVGEKQIDYYEKYGLETCDKRAYRTYSAICNSAQECDYSNLTQQQLIAQAQSLKERASGTDDWKDVAVEAFALVSEAGYRTLGYRHHWAQYFGACCMLDDNIAQILNGEGKTYAILLVAFTHYVLGRRTDIIDSGEHLCRRNYNWVGIVLKYLGVKVGLLANDYASAKELQAICSCDVVYSHLNAFMFGLLRCETSLINSKFVGDALIADEADEVMIEKGYRRFHLSGNVKANVPYTPNAVYLAMRKISDDTEAYFEIDHRGNIKIKSELYKLVQSIHSETNDPDPNWEAGLNEALRIAIIVFYKLERDRDYYIEGSKILVEDTQSGSLNVVDSGNTAYFIARKECLYLDDSQYVKYFTANEVVNYQTFRHLVKNVYKRSCGTTATAMSMKNEFERIYGKKVICVPPNKPSVRLDHSPRVFVRKAERDTAVARAVADMYKAGRPVLVITSGMYEAERYSVMLDGLGVPHTTLNARNAYDEERVLANCGRLGAVTIATAIANRGVDIALGGSASFITKDKLRGSGVTDEDIAIALSGDDRPFYKAIAVSYAITLKKTVSEVEANRDKVQELGGLAVICASCFEELRVEQQARGRCGRQGQKGESWVFVALEDDIMKRVYGPMLARFSGLDGEFDSELLNKALQKYRDKDINMQ